MMKIALNILAVVFIIIGAIWFLQGVNVLPGSFMSGNSLYAVLGAIVGLIGLVTLFLANRPTRRS